MDLGHDVLKDKQFRFPALKHIIWLVIGVKVWALCKGCIVQYSNKSWTIDKCSLGSKYLMLTVLLLFIVH